MWSPHCRGLHSVGTLPPSPAPVDSPGDFHLPSHPCFYPCWVPKATLSEPMVPCDGDVEHHCGGGGWWWRGMQLLLLGSSPLPVPGESRCGGPLLGCRGVASPCCLVRGREHPASACRGLGREMAPPQRERVWIPRIPRPDKELESAAWAGRVLPSLLWRRAWLLRLVVELGCC